MSDRPAPPLRPVLVALALALGTILLYWRSVGYGFVDYDDPRYIVANTEIHGGFTAESLRWAFVGHEDIWNPVVRLTHILDLELFGLRAAGHHLQNILWHALNAALAFLLLRRLTGAFWTAALAAALFAWHPLRVESVSWISERKDVVSVAFGLLTILAYAAYARHRAAGRAGTAAYAWTLLAAAAALLSKPSMVVLPALMLVLDYWPLRRTALSPPAGSPFSGVAESPVRLLGEKIPFAALAATAAWLTVHTQAKAGDFVLDLSLGARLANALVSLPRYLGKLFWPFDLSCAYPHPGWWPWPVIGAAVFFAAAVTCLSWRLRRSFPWIAVGWLWFVGALLPMIGLVQVGFQSMADRYTYFPILGAQLALLWSARALLPARLPRAIPFGLSIVLLAGCAARTWDQQRHWSDSIALYRQAVAATPDNPVAHGFLGFTYAAAGRLGAARAEAERALALAPRHHLAVFTLARIEAAEGRTDAAIARYREALAIQPDNLDGVFEFADYLLNARQLDEAEQLLRSVLDQPDARVPSLQGLALVALARGETATAERTLVEALALAPDNVPVLERLAQLLVAAGRAEEATALFDRALARQPRAAELLRAHAVFFHATGRNDEALAAFDRAIALRPHTVAFRHERAQLLAAVGRTADALAAYDEILHREPTYAAAAAEAGGLLERDGETERAAAYYRRAVAIRPTLVPAQLALARLLLATGRVEESDAAFTAALLAAPRSAPLLRAFAESLARRRRFDEALVHYRGAVEAAPADTEARAGYGFVLFLTGRKIDALAQWEEVLRLNPDFPGLRARVVQLRQSVR